MKKTIFAAVLLAAFQLQFSVSHAQQVLENNYDGLKVRYVTPDVKPASAQEGYILLQMEGYSQGGVHGCPSLPVQTSLLSVPFCDGMEVVVENAVYEEIQLPEGQQVLPLQPSRPKSDREKHPLFIDNEVYASDAFFGQPLASVEAYGVGRDRNYATLSFSPVSVNPVSGKVSVCRSADITVRYRNADVARTIDYLQRYYTPAFGLGSTLNEMVGLKAVRNTAPVRMVIVVGQGLQCYAIQEFATWKRTQGMMVDIVTPSSYNATSIANTLKALYTNATEASPAPTYVLLVGDVAQMPVHSTQLSNSFYWSMQLDSDHATDLYYTTWSTDDVLPDCYLGRFSATDTSTLRSIIDKTMYYEKYQFLDDSYLTRAALVAGVSSDNHGYSHADPTMDYIALQYVNAANGYNTVKYYKNNTNSHPIGVTVTGSSQSSSTASALKNFYNLGAGWVNYSAHGDWDMWYDPAFNVTDASRMTNTNMPSFMIGNCCLSNSFNKSTCLGEALLRKGSRAGAVAYIGGTNSTIWDQDFYWSVGVRNSVSANMALDYSALNKGMYDHLFHTHGEALSDYGVTAGKMLFNGNMAVQNAPTASSVWYGTTAELKRYYWEIYELMGDPSLMPWLGRAETLNVVLSVMGSNLRVAAAPGAYVALVANNGQVLQSSAFAGTDGVVLLPLPSIPLEQCFVSVTAQGYRPVQKACTNGNLGIAGVDADGISLTPNPATDHATVSAAGLQQVAVLDMTGRTLLTLDASGDRCVLDVAGLPGGLYLLRIVTDSGTATRKLVVR